MTRRKSFPSGALLNVRGAQKKTPGGLTRREEGRESDS
jgi:hypothetical protein